MKRVWLGALLAVGTSVASAADVDRGQLLYSTYCEACHTEQVHWREKKLVHDWSSLVAQVARWQANGNLDWSRGDVETVARYLNALHYRYPERGR